MYRKFSDVQTSYCSRLITLLLVMAGWPLYPSWAVAQQSGSGRQTHVYDVSDVDRRPFTLRSPGLGRVATDARQDTLIVAYIVDTTGSVDSASIVFLDRGHPALEAAFIQMLTNSVYSPGRLDGRPVAVRMQWRFPVRPPAQRDSAGLAEVRAPVMTPRDQVRFPPSGEMLFVVRGSPEPLLEPLAVVELDGRLGDPHNSIPPEWLDTLALRYYGANQRYRVLWHNVPVGTAVGIARAHRSCYDITGHATLDVPDSLPTDWVGFATSDESMGGRRMARSATDAEAAELWAAARSVAGENGLADSLIGRLRPRGPTLVVMPHDRGLPTVVGAYFLSVGGVTPRGFVYERQISVLTALELSPDRVRTLDLFSDASGDLVRTYQLVDVVDLDGDGSAEMVTRTDGYEGWSYTIHGFSNAEWHPAHTALIGGC